MIAAPALTAATLGHTDIHAVRDALRGEGLWFDLGAAIWRVQSDSPVFADHLRLVYGGFPFQPTGGWADLHCQILRQTGLRRWVRPQLVFRCDGQNPFEAFPADSPLPLFEWGGNWMAASRLNHLLLLHAGALERDGLALLLPAVPGSGKSTLTAGLSQRGWRLLSDEFGAYDPAQGVLRAMLKPVALKNQSIEVIRRFAPEAVMGPAIPRTRKGTVAHLAAGAAAIAARQQVAKPGAVILPKWQAGSRLRLEPIAGQLLFSAVAFNAFNYRVLGQTGFESAVRIAQACPGWQLTYSDLDEAVAALDRLWPEVVAHHQAREAA